MPKVRMRVKAVGSLADFSVEHPDIELKFLSSWPTVEGVVTIIEAKTKDPMTILSYFDDAPEVCSHEALHTDDQTVVVQFSMSDPEPYRAARDSGNLPTHPMIIRNGWIISETITSHDRLSAFKEEMESTDIIYEIISITQSTDPTDVLTDRQQQFITEAITHGYYDSPRQCSLTELAMALDVTKGTASGILHRGEEQIIKEFMEYSG